MYELFLAEQGVELELRADLDEVVRVLDREVSGFGTDTRRFKLEALKDEAAPVARLCLLTETTFPPKFLEMNANV